MNDASGERPDYYAILGVAQDASTAEIVAAFYARARKHHPDTSAHKDPASRVFKALCEAYEVLADPGRRREYDRGRLSYRVEGRRGASRTASWNRTAAARGPETGTLTEDDLSGELPVTPEEARFGGPCELRLIRQFRCLDCDGRGSDDGRACARCSASGRIARTQRMAVALPRGVRSGTVLCLPGKGHQRRALHGPHETRYGCLYLHIIVRPCW